MERIKMEALDKELNETIKVWPKISKTISTINSKAKYNRAIKMLDMLIDRSNKKEDSSTELLIDTIGTLIKDYEDRNIPEPKGSDAIDCLQYLMQEHGLNQNDLKEIGSQGVVSEILNRKRKLNLRQISALSKKFKVSPFVFLDE